MMRMRRNSVECYAPKAIAEAMGSRGVQVWNCHNYALEQAKSTEYWRRTASSELGLVHDITMQKVETTLSTLEEDLARSAVA
jgi:hypothetical protein